MSGNNRTNWGLIAAIGAATLASACCTLPLLLVALGLGGAWAGTLPALEPLRPLFIALALGALGYAGYRAWRMSRHPDCAGQPGLSRGVRRTLLLLGFIAVVGLIASPWIIRGMTSAGGDVPARIDVAAEHVVLEVEGMTCASCNGTVRRALIRVEGVQDARVTFEPPQAVVTYNPSAVSIEQFVEATAKAGYPSKPVSRP